MFNFNKKNKIDASYFARVDDSRLDFEDDLIQSIAEQSGELTRYWPNVKLADLQSFLFSLTNDVVRASDRDLQIGTITFFEKNTKGRDVATGLSWENAILTPVFENIAVSTAEHIFNASSVRQDEETDYDTIVGALEPLFDACLKATNLTEADLPRMPSEQGYRKAQENGEVLEIEANRFTIKSPVSEEPKVTDTQIPESNQKIDNDEPQIDTTVDDIPVKPMAKEQKIDIPVEMGPQPASIYDEEQSLIDLIDLKTVLFPVETDIKPVPAESEDYILSMLNADRIKANDFLSETSLMYTQKVRKTLADFLKTSQTELANSVKKIRSTDVLATVKTQLESERENEFTTRYDMQKKARKSGFDAEMKAEIKRHDTAVETLKNSYYRDLEELNVSVHEQLDEWYLKRSRDMQQSIQQSIDEDVKEQSQLANDKLITELKSLRDEFLTQHTQSLVDLQEKLSHDIEQKRLEHKREHDEAVIQATKLATAKSQSAHLGELEEQLFAVKKQNATLSDNMTKVSDEAQDKINALTQEKLTLSTETKELKKLLEEQKVAQIKQEAVTALPVQNKDEGLNQQLLNLLTAQITPKRDENQSTKPKRIGILPSLAIGALCALALGGTAIGAYTYGHQESKTQTKTSSNSSSRQSSIVLGSNSGASTASHQPATPQSVTSATSTPSAQSSQQAQPSTANPLEQKYHVGEAVKATINGQDVTATVSGFDNGALILNYENQSYKVTVQ
ncbi:hypothetical protein LNP18_06335 [Leuconostoc citreum]|uniref:hypothetical protein n=1 Tax=Leuconostoc citreum TaxID=33964 RepID=UPI00200AFE17|nr:hypothetical protein [Leuconostoc citreum]MCK8605721.1 hypothetical protein [Leuconostoc citreum]